MTLFTNDSEGSVVLRVSGFGCKTAFSLADSCKVRNDSSKNAVSRVLVGLGDDFESANAAVMYHARTVISAAETATGEEQKAVEAWKEENEATKLWAENWYDGLTYCEYDPHLI